MNRRTLDPRESRCGCESRAEVQDVESDERDDLSKRKTISCQRSNPFCRRKKKRKETVELTTSNFNLATGSCLPFCFSDTPPLSLSCWRSRSRRSRNSSSFADGLRFNALGGRAIAPNSCCELEPERFLVLRIGDPIQLAALDGGRDAMVDAEVFCVRRYLMRLTWDD